MTLRDSPPSFEELATELARRQIISRDVAKSMIGRKDTQTLAVMRQKSQLLRASGIAGTPAPAHPIELVMSCVERDVDGQPLREDVVTEIYANIVGLPYVKLDPLKLDPDFAVRMLSKPFARKHGYLAIEERSGALVIATHNPFDKLALESVTQVTGKRLELVIASRADIDRLIVEFYGFRQSVQRAEEHLGSTIDLGNLEQFVRMKSEQEIEASDEHVVHAVDYMMRYAFGQHASDIHVEPKRNESLVRFRIDGALHPVSQLPRIVHNAVINRIKTLARLDIAEKRRPQDGRIKTEFNGKPVEIRVSTLPVAFGEKVVMRIFDPELVNDDFKELGFEERDRTVFEELMRLPHGIILVTGPTGSGKTTSLYTALRKLATSDVNITTIEDPIEMVFEGINQTAILPAIGLGFAECLRTLLRQDPDILMVGEIRDLDTARHAIQAALTGHLVFSTLHTNDAPSAVTRLVDLGVQPFLLSSTLVGLMAQRLVRRVCGGCLVTRELSEEEIAFLRIDKAQRERAGIPTEGPIKANFGAGCAECRNTGYKGRAAIVELFKISSPIRALIHTSAPEQDIKEQARKEGMSTLREAAVHKLLTGETTYGEVVEVTSES
jgi:general secretion pathway protein E